MVFQKEIEVSIKFFCIAVFFCSCNSSTTSLKLPSFGAQAPVAPQNIRVENINFFSVDIFWTPSESFGREANGKPSLLKAYDIEYSVHSNFSNSKTITSVTAAIHLKNLKTNTLYNVRVRAVNNNGVVGKEASLNTNQTTTIFTTKKILSITPPQEFVAIPGDVYIDLSWKKPYSNGKSSVGNVEVGLSAYKIQLFAQGSNSSMKELFIPPELKSYRILGLKSKTSYAVRISSKNQEGQVSNFKEKTITTTNAKMKGSSPISKFSVTERDKKTIIGWDMPSHPGNINSQTPAQIKAYRLYYSVDKTFLKLKTKEETVLAPKTDITLKLNGDTSYYFRISAINNATLGGGISSVPVETRYRTSNYGTPPTAPFLNKGEVVQKAGILTFKWTHPSQPGTSAEGVPLGASVVSYIVEYTKKQTNPNFNNLEGQKEHVPNTPDDRTISFSTELSKGTVYLFRVYAVNDARKESPKSNVIEVTKE